MILPQRPIPEVKSIGEFRGHNTQSTAFIFGPDFRGLNVLPQNVSSFSINNREPRGHLTLPPFAKTDIPDITTESFIIAVILIAEKYRLTTVPALSDVMWYAGYYYPCHPGQN